MFAGDEFYDDEVTSGPVERVVPSYDLWRTINEYLESGTALILIPPGLDQKRVEQSIGCAIYGLARPGDVPVKTILPRAAK